MWEECDVVSGLLPSQPPKDWMLIAAIGVFLAIDMVYLIIITAVPQTRLVASEIELVGAMHWAVLIQGGKRRCFMCCIECLTPSVMCWVCNRMHWG